jgi:hypothetical protein
MAGTSNVPGNVNIKTVSIHSPKGTVNATELVIYMNIYESIFMPTFYAEVILRSEASIANLLPLVGEEKINIEFATPSRETATYELHITNMEDAQTTSNQKSKTFKLVCLSTEIFNHKTRFIQKSYNTNIHSIIDDICTKYLETDKDTDFRETKGVHKVIVPNMKPFQAIDMLRRRAVSSQDESSSFVFFENKDGFHFKTIETLFKEGEVGDRNFKIKSTAQSDAFSPFFRNILAFNQPRQYDTLGKLGGGGVNVQTKVLDFKDLTYKVKDNPNLDNKKYAGAEGKLSLTNSPEFNQLFGKFAGAHSLIPVDTNMFKSFIDEMTPKQKSFVSQIAQGTVNKHIYGDSEMSAGQLVSLDIFEPEGTTSTTSDKLISGKYLVASLRHIIGPEGSNPRYTCAVECIKGGYKEDPVQ